MVTVKEKTTTEGDLYRAAGVRRADLRDAAALAQLYRRAWPDTQETEASIRDILEQGGALLLEGTSGKIACALRWLEEEQGWHLDRLATLPEERGKGFGRWLMTQVEAIAIRQNVPGLYLRLLPDEEDLLAYYRRLGYRETPDSSTTDGILLTKRVGGTWQYKERE